MEAYAGSLQRYVRGILSHYVGVTLLLSGVFSMWVTAFGLPIDNIGLCHGPLGSCSSLGIDQINFLLQVMTMSLWTGLVAIPLGAILLLRSGISSRLADRRGRALRPL
jgi:hypothetical protein